MATCMVDKKGAFAQYHAGLWYCAMGVRVRGYCMLELKTSDTPSEGPACQPAEPISARS